MLQATLSHEFRESRDANYVINHYMGAAPGSTNIAAVLRRLCVKVSNMFNLNTEIPEDYK